MTILVGVSASVAIHRALDLVSELKKRGHDVTVLMTPGATRLITPLQFQAISGRRVHHDVFGGTNEHAYDHLSPARDGELYVYCPATADLIARLAHGMGDDMVTTTALAYQGPSILAPAMNWRMWANPLVQRNLQILRDVGFQVVDPADGDLACGEEGPGRLASIVSIIEAIEKAAS